MKKVILTVFVLGLGVIGYAQSNATSTKLLKYITTGPDGSVAMMVSDEINGDKLKLESADNFYKFEILEPSTSEALYSAKNHGKETTIDKSKLSAGTYDLKLYTASFVITSKITISASRKMKLPGMPAGDVVAANDFDE